MARPYDSAYKSFLAKGTKLIFALILAVSIGSAAIASKLKLVEVLNQEYPSASTLANLFYIIAVPEWFMAIITFYFWKLREKLQNAITEPEIYAMIALVCIEKLLEIQKQAYLPSIRWFSSL